MGSTSTGPCSYYKSRCSLPSLWEPRVSGIRNQHAMQYLKVDGTRVRYVGPGDDDSQAATIRANYPLPADCPLYYFEVKVLNKGQAGFIGIGFCTDEVLLTRLPGWDPHSYGYHGDDGHAFSGSGTGRPYGPSFTTGDVVGALYDKAERTISYYKNGQPLGVAFRDVQEASPLYPCVGLRTRSEEVVANFGTGSSSEPFRTDLAAVRADFQHRVRSTIRKTELPLLSSRGTALLPQLMYDYLMHQRFWRTAAALGCDLLRSEGQMDERELADITVRQQSYDLVVSGRIDEALSLLKEKYPPELLSERPSLDFRLRVQKFVEMVAAAHAAAATAAAASSGDGPGAAAGTSSAAAAAGDQLSHSAAAASTSGLDAAAGTPAGSRGAADGGRPEPMETAEDGATRGSVGSDASGRAAADGGGPVAAEGGSPGSATTAAAAAAAAAPPPTIRQILAYGAIELWPRCRTPVDRDLMTEALSLLAFSDPAASPAGEMLRPAHRTALAEELNGAMLACRGLPTRSPLERLYQQLYVVVSQLKQLDHPQALALPDPSDFGTEPLLPLTASGGAGGGGGGGPSGSGSGSDAPDAMAS
ncbi:hypothetical protein PLESTF_000812400 [Pleodorina starrii]|nr:hypothetical protein PLESTM_001333100 [Pleodorina starrii]GLC69293.1 hypothetical protein PLESTF_000812400 [Pleodorina starrii]